MKKVWITAVASEEVYEVYDNKEASEQARQEIIDEHNETPHNVQTYERVVHSQ